MENHESFRGYRSSRQNERDILSSDLRTRQIINDNPIGKSCFLNMNLKTCSPTLSWKRSADVSPGFEEVLRADLQPKQCLESLADFGPCARASALVSARLGSAPHIQAREASNRSRLRNATISLSGAHGGNLERQSFSCSPQ
jgi:hypothetical protein